MTGERDGSVGAYPTTPIGRYLGRRAGTPALVIVGLALAVALAAAAGPAGIPALMAWVLLGAAAGYALSGSA